MGYPSHWKTRRAPSDCARSANSTSKASTSSPPRHQSLRLVGKNDCGHRQGAMADRVPAPSRAPGPRWPSSLQAPALCALGSSRCPTSGAAASDRPAGIELIPSPDRLPPTGPTLLEKGTDIHRWTNGHLWRESVGTGPLRQAEGRDSAPSKPQGRRKAASVPASHPRQSMQTNTPKTDQGAAPPGPPQEVRRSRGKI